MEKNQKKLTDEELTQVSGGLISRKPDGSYMAFDDKTGKELGGGSLAGAQCAAGFFGVSTQEVPYDDILALQRKAQNGGIDIPKAW